MAGRLVDEDFVVAEHVEESGLAGVVETEEEDAGTLVIQTEVTDRAEAQGDRGRQYAETKEGETKGRARPVGAWAEQGGREGIVVGKYERRVQRF